MNNRVRLIIIIIIQAYTIALFILPYKTYKMAYIQPDSKYPEVSFIKGTARWFINDDKYQRIIYESLFSMAFNANNKHVEGESLDFVPFVIFLPLLFLAESIWAKKPFSKKWGLLLAIQIIIFFAGYLYTGEIPGKFREIPGTIPGQFRGQYTDFRSFRGHNTFG